MEDSKQARPETLQDWEDRRQVIEQLYWEEEKSLPDVIEIMKREHGFSATTKQYKRHFERWKLKKNVNTREMKAMLRIQKQRKSTEDKDTRFTVRGRPVPSQKIQRFQQRQRPQETETSSTTSANTPPGIVYSTPSPPKDESAAAPHLDHVNSCSGSSDSPAMSINLATFDTALNFPLSSLFDPSPEDSLVDLLMPDFATSKVNTPYGVDSEHDIAPGYGYDFPTGKWTFQSTNDSLASLSSTNALYESTIPEEHPWEEIFDSLVSIPMPATEVETGIVVDMPVQPSATQDIFSSIEAEFETLEEPGNDSTKPVKKITSSSRQRMYSKGRRASMLTTRKPLSDDWSEVNEREERRRIQNRLAQRKFREKCRKDKERAEEAATSRRDPRHQFAGQSYISAEAVVDDDDLSGLPWGSLVSKYIVSPRADSSSYRGSSSSRRSSFGNSYSSHSANYSRASSYDGARSSGAEDFYTNPGCYYDYDADQHEWDN